MFLLVIFTPKYDTVVIERPFLNAYDSSPMRGSKLIKSQRFGHFSALVFGLCLLCVIPFQVVEASHLHVDDYEVLECVQCQSDTGSGIVTSLRTELSARYSDEIATTRSCLALATFYSLSAPRGPPVLP